MTATEDLPTLGTMAPQIGRTHPDSPNRSEYLDNPLLDLLITDGDSVAVSPNFRSCGGSR